MQQAVARAYHSSFSSHSPREDTRGETEATTAGERGNDTTREKEQEEKVSRKARRTDRQHRQTDMAIGKQQDAEEPMAPVHFFSHGSTMMLGEESASADYWKKAGDEALANGVEHVVMMGAHWATTLPGVLVSAHPKPSKSPVAYVHPSKYAGYALTPDPAFTPVVMSYLAAAGIPATAAPDFDWIHDTYLVLIRMFPGGCPPTTIVSMNQRFDPHFHVAVGAALRPLRAWNTHRTLFVGSGGAVHNLYRNVWAPMLRFRDNFAQPSPPEPWALDFRHEVLSALCPGHEADLPADRALGGRAVVSGKNKGAGGPALRRRMTSLMKHPRYRDAHGTDDHFMAALFVAGLCGGPGDEKMRGEMGAEDWELTNMCNSQFTLGSWAEVK
ncbi:Extradiol ring-cleavage dioxygenase, class III enzyme, subunit B [Xylariaceae sp. FL0804]|nr:Extradiol ring-cleavage dioxygenase, class III enzyme, subunit B [Xylariaceae sp. FL0804]